MIDDQIADNITEDIIGQLMACSAPLLHYCRLYGGHATTDHIGDHDQREYWRVYVQVEAWRNTGYFLDPAYENSLLKRLCLELSLKYGWGGS